MSEQMPPETCPQDVILTFEQGGSSAGLPAMEFALWIHSSVPEVSTTLYNGKCAD